MSARPHWTGPWRLIGDRWMRPYIGTVERVVRPSLGPTTHMVNGTTGASYVTVFLMQHRMTMTGPKVAR